MWQSTLFLFSLLLLQATSVRILDLRVPAHIVEGGEAILGCQYDVDTDILYSVKWYKGDREFYQYVPTNVPHARYFHTSGVSIDLTRSSSNVVTLVNLTKESRGLYGCEVSGEAPHFATDHKEKYIDVYRLPENPPRITDMSEHYSIGDQVDVMCVASPSRPPAEVKWLINGYPALEEYFAGFYTRDTDDGSATLIMTRIQFTLKPSHFIDGVVSLRCQATIAPLYQEETEQRIFRFAPTTERFEAVDRKLQTQESLEKLWNEANGGYYLGNSATSPHFWALPLLLLEFLLL